MTAFFGAVSCFGVASLFAVVVAFEPPLFGDMRLETASETVGYVRPFDQVGSTFADASPDVGGRVRRASGRLLLMPFTAMAVSWPTEHRL